MEAMLMIWPLPWACMVGSTPAMPQSTPLTLTSTIRSHSSTFSASSGESGITPALLISTSMRPQRSSAACAKRDMAARSVTSSSRNSAVPPAARMSPARASSRSALRAPSISLAPAAPSSRAMAAPMPLLAPVMRTTFSVMFMTLFSCFAFPGTGSPAASGCEGQPRPLRYGSYLATEFCIDNCLQS